MSADSTGPRLVELPDAVRSRVCALAADVLPDVVRLPPSLRRVAAFAPTRRARLGGTAIAAALDADDELRERVATQLGARPAPPLSPGDPAEPVETAARAWVLRAEGWQPALDDAVRRVAERAAAPAVPDAEVERLRRRTEQAEQAVRELRERHRAQVEDYKTENAALRRKLGEARQAERAARGESGEELTALGEARARAEALVATQDKELRQLRAQLAQRESEASSERRAVRSEREEASLRARLLLDTVLDAASGLRRELALPPVTGAPGDRVEAGLADRADHGTRTPSSAGALGAGSAALLEQYLTMPRARLIVDGYNVTKSTWPSSSLEAQRIRLLNALAPVVARTGVETTVVFDAAASSVRPVVTAPRGIKVLFSPEGVIADDVIRELVAAEPPGRVVVVVTDDREIVTDVTRAGARPAASAALAGLLTRSG